MNALDSTPITFNTAEAIRLMKSKGAYAITRLSWVEGTELRIVEQSAFAVISIPFVCPGGIQYYLSYEDLMATDWVLL